MDRGTKLKHSAVALLGAAALTACGTQTVDGTGAGSGAVKNDVAVTGVRWVPESVTVDGKKYPLPPDADAHVEFEPGRAEGPGGKSGGSAGCNSLGADVEVEGDTVTVSDVAMTEKGCAEDVQRFEERFAEVFTGALTAELSGKGETLVLTKDNGDSITFGPEPPGPQEPLEGTEWVVTGLVDGGTAKSLPAEVEGKAHFTIGEDGRAGGSLGCNGFSTEAAVKGDRIEFGEIASSRRMCPGPVMKTENELREILSGKVTHDREDGTLTLTTDSGKGLTATAARK
ncbi:META domain-containing protein [Streptomyces sp. SCUT-3]|uniref:META domain-containing protein n=1 Tax=Streptomyces sp. SCUT-3 TaxID=2684469 RepID=UPI000CA9A9F9|nr:META domain-containing protein [Streptomyces sp. SCUT-3]PLW71206.1 hypothetical protein C0036_19055 [Streptomyces sp. DJ]QMV21674.1 META domain-containing protein [Streptomyces sp. SCUT-3]